MPLTDEQIQMLLKRERAGSLSAEQVEDVGALRKAGQFPEALAPAEGSARSATTPSPEELVTRGIIGSGFGTQPFGTPEQRVGRAAFMARTAPGLIPAPLLSGPASAVGETIAQAAEQGVGVREAFDPSQIAVAWALPPGFAGVARTARALGRTATRALPSLFGRAQERALRAAEDVAEILKPNVEAGQLFQAARAAQETVPAGRVVKTLDDLAASIPKTPTDPGLKQVREAMETIRGVVQGDRIELAELLRQRLDLGRLIQRRGSSPELKALYGHGGANAKGIIGALEEAAEQGGAGAAMAREALDLFKRDLGVVRWKDLVEQATKRTAIGGADVPALSVAKLGNLVADNSKELARTLGAEGLELIQGFLTRFRSLPPTHAATAANTVVALMGGAGGSFLGGVPGAVAGVLGPEVTRNIFAVGRNPALVNQTMATIAQATRAAAVAR